MKEAVRKGTLGNLNPTPWAVMSKLFMYVYTPHNIMPICNISLGLCLLQYHITIAGNCIGWVTYSFLINNLFVFGANMPGLILSVWLNMAAAKLQYSDRIAKDMRKSFVQLLDRNRQSFRLLPGTGMRLDVEGDSVDNLEGNNETSSQNDTSDNNDTPQSFANLKQMALDITIQKTEAPAPHEKIVVAVVTFWVSLISLLYFLQLDINKWKNVVGIITNINTCMFYGAPLSTIYSVLEERDSSSIHRPTMIMNTSNAVFWTAFGFGTWDWFILIPNGLGCILGAIQIFLQLVLPNKSKTSTAELVSDDIEVVAEVNKAVDATAGVPSVDDEEATATMHTNSSVENLLDTRSK